MTAATSSKLVNFFGTRFRNNIPNNKKLLIVNSILQALCLPVLAIIVLISMYCNELSIIDTNQNLRTGGARL